MAPVGTPLLARSTERLGRRRGERGRCYFLRVHKHTSSLKMASIGIPCTPTAADKAERVSASESHWSQQRWQGVCKECMLALLSAWRPGLE